MNVNAILDEHAHKVGWEVLAKEALNDNTLLNGLFQALLTGEERYARTAAEVLRHASDHDKSIAQPFICDLIKRIPNAPHPGITRCIFRLFQYATFTDEQAGKVTDLAFSYLTDRNNPVAIRVFAMSTLANISRTYPELRQELIAVLGENLSEERAGYQNRASKIINGTWK